MILSQSATGSYSEEQTRTYGGEDQHIDVDQGQATVENGDESLIPAAQILWTAYKSTGPFRDRQILRGRRAIMTQEYMHAGIRASLFASRTDRKAFCVANAYRLHNPSPRPRNSGMVLLIYRRMNSHAMLHQHSSSNSIASCLAFGSSPVPPRALASSWSALLPAKVIVFWLPHELPRRSMH